MRSKFIKSFLTLVLAMPRSPQAVAFRSWVSLLSSLVRVDRTVHLVICMPREGFIDSLVSEISSTSNDDVLVSNLLDPSIHFVKASRDIQMTFVPSLMHLRAYLSSLQNAPLHGLKAHVSSAEKVETAPLLALARLFHLHSGTSEFSAQGLSRILALAVDVAAGSGFQLQILEILEPPGEQPMEQSGLTDGSPWTRSVPLLNSSIRSRGDEQVWAGRTIEYGRILRPWCHVQDLRS